MLGLPLHVQPGLADRKLIDRLEGPVQGFVPGNAGYAQSSVHRLLKGVWGRSAAPIPPSAVSLVIAARSIRSGGTPGARSLPPSSPATRRCSADPEKRKNICFGLAVTDVPAFAASVQRHLQKGDEPLRPEWIGNATTAEILKTTDVFVWRLAKATPDLLKAHQDRYPKKQNPRT
jgi:hypothetical protein